MIEIRILLKELFIEALAATLNCHIQFLDDVNFICNSPCAYSKGHSQFIHPLFFPIGRERENTRKQ